MSDYEDFMVGRTLLTYYYPILGGSTPVSFTSDGWVCTSVALSEFGKSLHSWKKTKSALLFLTTLLELESSQPLLSSYLYDTPTEKDFIRTFNSMGKGGGFTITFVHPYVASTFFYWVNIRLAIWTNHKVTSILNSYRYGTYPPSEVLSSPIELCSDGC